MEASAPLAHTDFRTTETHYLASGRQMAVRVARHALRRRRRNAGPDKNLDDDDCYVDDQAASKPVLA